MHIDVWWGSLKETAKLTGRSMSRWKDNIKMDVKGGWVLDPSHSK